MQNDAVLRLRRFAFYENKNEVYGFLVALGLGAGFLVAFGVDDFLPTFFLRAVF